MSMLEVAQLSVGFALTGWQNYCICARTRRSELETFWLRTLLVAGRSCRQSCWILIEANARFRRKMQKSLDIPQVFLGRRILFEYYVRFFRKTYFYLGIKKSRFSKATKCVFRGITLKFHGFFCVFQTSSGRLPRRNMYSSHTQSHGPGHRASTPRAGVFSLVRMQEVSH